MTSLNILPLARPEIRALRAYESARSKVLATHDQVFLDANELRSSITYPFQNYPNPEPPELLAVMSQILKCDVNNIFLGPGADSAIDALSRVFLTPYQDEILITPPTYGYYKIAAEIQGARVLEVPLETPRFELNFDKIFAALTPKTKLIYICSPNNPTGNLYPVGELRRGAERLGGSHILVIDEAYIDFAAGESLLADGLPDNVVVLRTFSKAYGMAGLRLGVAIAHESIINLLKKVRAPYPIPQPVVDIALKELSRDIRVTVDEITRERELLRRSLKALATVKDVYPSAGNFLLVRFYDALKAYSALAAENIVVRRRGDEPLLVDCLRITVGHRTHNEKVMRALSSMSNSDSFQVGSVSNE